MSQILVILVYLATIYLAAYFLLFKPITLNKTFDFPVEKWLGTVFLITSAGFIINNIWLFYLFLFTILKYLYKTPDTPYGYVSLLYIIPVIFVDIPGIGPINALFGISYHRFLVIVLLLPYFFYRGATAFKRITWKITDKIVLLYSIYLMLMVTRDNNVTNSLREVFLILIDIVVPYYAMRAFIEDRNLLGKAASSIDFCLDAIFFITIILAMVAIFESLMSWHIYSDMVRNLFSDRLLYAYRSGILRAAVTFSGPIILGYVLMIGLGIIQYFSITGKISRSRALLFSMIVVSGLFFTLSRGPWLATVAMYLTFLFFYPNTLTQYMKLGISLLFSGVILSFTPFLDKVINLLPIIGNTDMHTIDYRARLIDMSWRVFLKNPLFGDIHFLETPEMESMRQGQGIIDMVNVFVHIALQYGSIGLFLFTMIFVTAIISAYQSAKFQRSKSISAYWKSVLFLSLLVGIVLTIATVSNINFIPITYWLILSLSVSHVSTANKNTIRTSVVQKLSVT